jgi:hypothetical protein
MQRRRRLTGKDEERDPWEAVVAPRQQQEGEEEKEEKMSCPCRPRRRG